METALLMGRLLLCIAFVLAGMGKLADLAGSQRAIRAFGIMPALASPLGILLPLGELVLAFSLIPVASAWWGAIGAVALLLLFTTVISANLVRGRRPDCHCFGQLHSAPVSPTTLLRTALLTITAGFIVWKGRDNPGPSLVGGLATLSLVEIMTITLAVIALVVTAVEGWLLLHSLQQQGRLLLRLQALETGSVGNKVGPTHTAISSIRGLELGTSAPGFQLPNLERKMVTLADLCSANKPVLLIFSDPGCGPCNAFFPTIAYWQRDYVSQLTVVLITQGTHEMNSSKATEFGLTHVLLQANRDVALAYQSHATPSALMVTPNGKIGSTLATGVAQIQHLVGQAVQTPKVPLISRAGTT